MWPRLCFGSISNTFVLKGSETVLDAKVFLDSLFEKIKSKNIDLKPWWSIDHLCYRVSTLEDYNQKKNEFLKISRLLTESIVNGRPISTFKLDKPIIYNDYIIDLVELPAPKSGKRTIEGFEHAEIVCDQDFSELKKTFKNLDVDTAGLNKEINQELEIKLDDIAIKFHHYSLESIINIENNKLVFQSLIELNILSSLKSFQPVIVGTIPLAIATSNSDLELLLSFEDRNSLENQLTQQFSRFQEYEMQRKNYDSTETLVCRFKYNNLRFEIFAQPKSTYKQRAFRHFQVEGRLLKIGGTNFQNKVLDLKKLGSKTEVAFAQILKLTQDPYLALEALYYKNDMELLQLFN